jgi:hypothetical protein
MIPMPSKHVRDPERRNGTEGGQERIRKNNVESLGKTHGNSR